MLYLARVIVKIVRATASWPAHLLLLGLTLAAVPAWAQTSVSIGTARDPNLASQIVIAQHKGFFKKEGLDANVHYFPSGGDLMAATVGGSVQMGSTGATPAITLRARPYPIVILSQMADISGAEQIVVQPSITSLEALYGKKIAIMKNTGSQALFESFAKAYNFDASKAKLVYMAPAEMLSSFSRGDVDAICVWEPFVSRARKLFKGRLLVSSTRSYIPGQEGPRRIYGDHSLLYSTQPFIREHPATVKAVVRALAHANDFIESNRAEAANIIAKQFGTHPEDMKEIMMENHYTLAIDDLLVHDIDFLTDFLHHQKNIQSKPEARTWIDPTYLREVRPQLVTIK